MRNKRRNEAADTKLNQTKTRTKTQKAKLMAEHKNLKEIVQHFEINKSDRFTTWKSPCCLGCRAQGREKRITSVWESTSSRTETTKETRPLLKMLPKTVRGENTLASAFLLSISCCCSQTLRSLVVQFAGFSPLQSRAEQTKDRKWMWEEQAGNPHTTCVASSVAGHISKESDQTYYKELTKF